MAKAAYIPLCAVALGRVYFSERNWARAAGFWRSSIDLIAGRFQSGSDAKKPPPGEGLFVGLVRALYRVPAEGATKPPAMVCTV